MSTNQKLTIENSLRGPQERQQLVEPATAVSASDTVSGPVLSPLEAWCLMKLDRLYRKSQSMKCPFLRRRSGDMLDNLENIIKHTVIRRECWPLMGPPQAWRPCGLNKKISNEKFVGISREKLYSHVLEDWKTDTSKGYYITGKVTTGCYRDDCYFSGPDPDMPIRGLRKYIGVAAQLFDTEKSFAHLKTLQFDEEDHLVAKWVLTGILRLPWRPNLPTISGTTIYTLDEQGLIARHEELWDISVSYAFMYTFFPRITARFWKEAPDTAT